MKKCMAFMMMFCIGNVIAKPVAQVLFTSNKVIAQNNGVSREIKRGSSLNVGDEIITIAEALVNIKYLNGTLVNIGGDTNYKILAYSPNSTSNQVSAELKRGKVKFKTTGQVNESLKTPVVALAILGTKANVYVENAEKTYVELFNGKIKAGNFYMQPGQSIQVTPSGVKSTPFPAGGNVPQTDNPGTIDSSSGASQGSNDKYAVSLLSDVSTSGGTQQTVGSQVVQATSVSGIATIDVVCH